MSLETHRSLENDGHRTVLRRTEDAVILYARSGRIVTSHWMDLAVPAMALRPGTTLDGEAVIWHGGRLDFGAVQARAASSLARAYALAARHPASYVAFDVLEHPDLGPVATRPYTERRGLLADVLQGIGPPIQAMTVCGKVSAGYRHLKCQWCSLGDLVVGTDGWCSPVADMGDERSGHSHADCYSRVRGLCWSEVLDLKGAYRVCWPWRSWSCTLPGSRCPHWPGRSPGYQPSWRHGMMKEILRAFP